MRQKHKSTYLQPKCALKAVIYHSKTIKKNSSFFTTKFLTYESITLASQIKPYEKGKLIFSTSLSVVPPGIEPGTQGFSVLCSTNWAMAPKWCANFLLRRWCHQESNRGHKDFQSFALPTELWHLAFICLASAKVGLFSYTDKLYGNFFAFGTKICLMTGISLLICCVLYIFGVSLQRFT